MKQEHTHLVFQQNLLSNMNLPVITTFKISESQEVSKVLNLAAPIGAICASLLILVLIIWPKVNEILELKSSNEQLVSRAQNLESKASLLSGLNQENLEKQLTSAEQLLPSDKNTFSILRQIENTAGLSGILLNRVEAVAGTINVGGSTAKAPAGGSAATFSPSVQIRLSTTSDYQSLLQFLSSLYAFSRVITIDAISLSAAVGEGIQIQTNFAIDAYWKSLPENLGSIEAPIGDLTQAEKDLLKDVAQPEVIQAPVLPEVPTGRGDIFSPF